MPPKRCSILRLLRATTDEPHVAICTQSAATGVLPLLTRVDRHYVPKGLVGVIGPWNYPLTMAICDGLAGSGRRQCDHAQA